MAKKVRDRQNRRLKRDSKTPMSPRVDDYQDGNGKFKKGNPGKPAGAISARTRLQNLLMSAFGKREAEVFAQFFKKADGNYLKALDRLLEAVNEGKGLAGLMGDQLPPLNLFIEPDNDK